MSKSKKTRKQYKTIALDSEDEEYLKSKIQADLSKQIPQAIRLSNKLLGRKK